MSWSFIAASTPATGANPVAALPAGHTAGDLLIIVGTSNASAFTTPSGWNARLLNGDSGNSSLSIWDKVDSGSESNVTVTNANATTSVVMLCYRNLNATPLDVAGTISTATSTTLATNSLTTIKNNDLIVSVWGVRNQAVTWTAPGSTTSRVTLTSSTTISGFLVVDENQAVLGASTARTATVNNSRSLAAFAISYREPVTITSGAAFLLLMI